MANRPILFSAPMVRALLAGRKTQTRRIINPTSRGMAPGQLMIFEGPRFGATVYRFEPRFEVGDRLYVREEWRLGRKWDDTKPSMLPERGMTVLYAAGGSSSNIAPGEWGYENFPAEIPDWAGRRRPGMHLPRWASRLTLTVTDVRVQRLQDCSEADAIAEGIQQYGRFFGLPDTDWDDAELTAVAAYHRLWNDINGAGAWEANPWVVAVSFDVRKGNIDD